MRNNCRHIVGINLYDLHFIDKFIHINGSSDSEASMFYCIVNGNFRLKKGKKVLHKKLCKIIA